MVKYQHDCLDIGKETAKALLGKKAYIVDVFDATLRIREDNFTYKLTIYTDDEGITVYIATSNSTETHRYERVIQIRIYGKGSQTDATRSIYEKEKWATPVSETVCYRDWVVPNAKKLQQIIWKLF